MHLLLSFDASARRTELQACREARGSLPQRLRCSTRCDSPQRKNNKYVTEAQGERENWCFGCLTFELSGRRRQDARPGPVKMYRVPPARDWWPAVGAPLERGVRRRVCGTKANHAEYVCRRYFGPRFSCTTAPIFAPSSLVRYTIEYEYLRIGNMRLPFRVGVPSPGFWSTRFAARSNSPRNISATFLLPYSR